VIAPPFFHPAELSESIALLLGCSQIARVQETPAVLTGSLQIHADHKKLSC